jgi:hypothetical protein
MVLPHILHFDPPSNRPNCLSQTAHLAIANFSFDSKDCSVLALPVPALFQPRKEASPNNAGSFAAYRGSLPVDSANPESGF